MTPTKPRLDGFEFLDYLGGGAFGQVWKARDMKLNVLRAVKVLPRERFREAEARRLLAEAQSMARLPAHRNRVAVHHFKEGVTNSFLVMDYVAGGALSQHTSTLHPLPWSRAAHYVAGVADALIDVHASGLLHRDIKPDNILWDPVADEARLGDFGIAVAADGANRGGGTPGYIAPEVRRGAATPKSDVFSLASSLLHLATGHRPADGVAPDRHAGWESLPEELQNVIRIGLDPEPDRRADLTGFLALLREARWKALTDRMLANVADTASVKLQATVSIAGADQPDAFRPLRSDGRLAAAGTGDFVKVEALANADGHLTVLVLESSGAVEVGLPSPAEPENRFRAGQRCCLVFRLTPPAGTERVLIHWSSSNVRRTASEWCQWVERAGLVPDDSHVQPQVRGAELVRVKKTPAPAGTCRVLVIPVPHVNHA
jgi:serine/threonine protein kinase